MPFLDRAYDAGDQLPDSWGICLYGQINSRKTSSLRTMPGHGWALDFPLQEGGANVLQGYSPRIKINTIRTWEEMDEAFWYFVQDNPKLPKRRDVIKKGEVWKDDDPRWNEVRAEWVAVDTVTAVQDVAKRKVMGERDKGLPSDPHTLAWKEYDKWYSIVQQGIWGFKTIPDLVTIWLAQERKVDPKDDNPEGWIGPNLRDRPLEALNPSMMLVARYFLAKNADGTDDYRVRILPAIEGTIRVIAKTRHPVDLAVPSVIRNINLGQLLAYTLKGQGAPPEAVVEEPATVLQFVA